MSPPACFFKATISSGTIPRNTLTLFQAGPSSTGFMVFEKTIFGALFITPATTGLSLIAAGVGQYPAIIS